MCLLDLFQLKFGPMPNQIEIALKLSVMSRVWFRPTSNRRITSLEKRAKFEFLYELHLKNL